MAYRAMADRTVRPESLLVGSLGLPGLLYLPRDPSGLVIFAHGSGSSRHSGRNQQVAEAIASQGMAALLFDLLRPEEEAANARAKVFDIGLLASRLTDVANQANSLI